MREKANDAARLVHILDAIGNVRDFMLGVNSLEEFDNNRILSHAVIYNIQCIGEATYRLSKDFRDTHQECPWDKIEKMRHFLVHDYYNVKIGFVWYVVQDELDPLESMVRKYLDELDR